MALHIKMQSINAALKNQKPVLRKVEHTIVTRRDGSRYKVNNLNGTKTELPKMQTNVSNKKNSYATALEEANCTSSSQQAEQQQQQGVPHNE